MKILGKVLLFASGVVTGYLLHSYISKRNEEIEYEDKYEEVEDEYEDISENPETPDKDETKKDEKKETEETFRKYTNILKKYRSPEIRLITPEEFDESDYEHVTLNWYTDGVLAEGDVTHNPQRVIDNPWQWVPGDFDEHFGEYAENVVYSINDKYKMVFEILREIRPAYPEEAEDG